MYPTEEYPKFSIFAIGNNPMPARPIRPHRHSPRCHGCPQCARKHNRHVRYTQYGFITKEQRYKPSYQTKHIRASRRNATIAKCLSSKVPIPTRYDTTTTNANTINNTATQHLAQAQKTSAPQTDASARKQHTPTAKTFLKRTGIHFLGTSIHVSQSTRNKL